MLKKIDRRQALKTGNISVASAGLKQIQSQNPSVDGFVELEQQITAAEKANDLAELAKQSLEKNDLPVEYKSYRN